MENISFGYEWTPQAYAGVIVINSEGDLYAIRGYNIYSGGFLYSSIILLKCTPWGSQVWNKSIDFGIFYGGGPGSSSHKISAISNGTFYMCGTSLIGTTGPSALSLIGYQVEEPQVSPTSITTTDSQLPLDLVPIAIYSVAVLLITLVAVDYVRRRRRVQS